MKRSLLASALSLCAFVARADDLGVTAQAVYDRVQQNESKLLKKRGLDENAEIITMCRSGSECGKPSADYLRDNGFPNARYVIDGFQGPAIKEGPQAGFRLLSGWQNSNLPWSPRMNAEKMYRP